MFGNGKTGKHREFLLPEFRTGGAEFQKFVSFWLRRREMERVSPSNSPN